MSLSENAALSASIAPSVGPTAVYGLVLAGGHSTRMHRDKAALEYHGTAGDAAGGTVAGAGGAGSGNQLARAMALLESRVARAFISVRRDQVSDPVRSRFAQIVDTREGLGPIAGIVAAQARFPHTAWLVVACDLPFLDGATLDHLLRSRRAGRQATAYRSSHDGLPEPLCAIYEPSTAAAICAYILSGRDCPRKFLRQADVELLDQPDPRALDNVNTPEDYGSAIARLHPVPQRGSVP
ncbi:MAG: NTP transferase domain-containing protein [Steroidobacteraceae bacterium]